MPDQVVGSAAEQLHEQPQLLLEDLFVIAEVVAKQRKRLDRRTTPEDQLRAPAGDGVQRREVVVQADRILGREHGHRGAEPDPLGPPGDRRKYHVRRRIHHVVAIVLADVERVDPDLLGEDAFLDRVANHLITADRLTIESRRDRHERVKPEFVFAFFHLSQSSFRRLGPCRAQPSSDVSWMAVSWWRGRPAGWRRTVPHSRLAQSQGLHRRRSQARSPHERRRSSTSRSRPSSRRRPSG